MRTNLVFELICAKCGHLLTLTDDHKRPGDVRGGLQDPSLPTGAGLDRHVIGVEPCRRCVGALTEAARAVTSGLRTLQGAE